MKPVSLLKTFFSFHLKLVYFSSKPFRKMSKFKCLVESEEGMRSFWAKYRIPPIVGMRYAAQGEWVGTRRTREVVIPMIAFIEGG